jgi:hypothetical protein
VAGSSALKGQSLEGPDRYSGENSAQPAFLTSPWASSGPWYTWLDSLVQSTKVLPLPTLNLITTHKCRTQRDSIKTSPQTKSHFCISSIWRCFHQPFLFMTQGQHLLCLGLCFSVYRFWSLNTKVDVTHNWIGLRCSEMIFREMEEGYKGITIYVCMNRANLLYPITDLDVPV